MLQANLQGSRDVQGLGCRVSQHGWPLETREYVVHGDFQETHTWFGGGTCPLRSGSLQTHFPTLGYMGGFQDTLLSQEALQSNGGFPRQGAQALQGDCRGFRGL